MQITEEPREVEGEVKTVVTKCVKGDAELLVLIHSAASRWSRNAVYN